STRSSPTARASLLLASSHHAACGRCVRGSASDARGAERATGRRPSGRCSRESSRGSLTGSRNPDNVGRMSEIRPETSPSQLLREWRERQKITRTKLAADLGISENYVWKIENRGFVP